MKPQAELHEVSMWEGIEVKGAKEIFDEAGVVVLSNNKVPEGKEYKPEWRSDMWGGILKFFGGGMMEMADGVLVPVPAPSQATGEGAGEELAEVERVRQFFPETWLWQEVITNT